MEKIKHFCTFSGTGPVSFIKEFVKEKTNVEIETIGFSDIDNNSLKFHKVNHPNIKAYGDITKIDPYKLPDFDLFTGGFPCQSFSIAGKREGFKAKDKGNLFFEIIRIISVKKPKYLLLENVRGLTNHDSGETLQVVVRELKKLGYGVAYKILNSKNYGTPQNRERIWFACKMGGWDFMEFHFPYSEYLKCNLYDLLESEKEIKNNYDNPDYFYLSEKQYKTALAYGLKKRGKDLTNNINKEVAACLTTGGDKRHLHDVNLVVHNLAPRTGDPGKGGTGHLSRDDGLSYCLDTSKTLFIESNSIKPRVLTPKERFRLMGFKDDSYSVKGISYTGCNNLTGNGWDLNVAKKVLVEMFSHNTVNQEKEIEND